MEPISEQADATCMGRRGIPLVAFHDGLPGASGPECLIHAAETDGRSLPWR